MALFMTFPGILIYLAGIGLLWALWSKPPPGRSGGKKSVMQVVARDGIEPPTPAFSGPRSTTELSGLS